jgi:putative nucleotidyltransferase with HDIG domain
MAARVAPSATVDYQRLEAAYRRSLRHADEARRLYTQLQRSVSRSLLGLAAALDTRDVFSRGHSDRVAALSRRIAQHRGLDPDAVAVVEQAALLHDVGTIAVPERTLRKTGALDETEWEQMRRHSIAGAQIVAPFEFFADVAPVIRHHHERWDGSGYPDGLAGQSIPLGARIVAVADVYDALLSPRPYRRALTRHEALGCLAIAAGRTLDATLVAELPRALAGVAC